MDIHQLRHEIPAVRNCIYLNTGWSGPSPTPVLDAIREHLEWENSLGPATPPALEKHKEARESVRKGLARLLGARPEEFTLTENTTQGINIITNGLEWRPGDEVVTCDLEHPSILIPCLYLQKRFGVVLKMVSLRDVSRPEDIVSRIEEAFTPRTRLLCLSHIIYLTGLRLPLLEIQSLARKHGVLILVDGAQSVGHIPVNLTQLGCDFYAFPGHKWLLGPDGVGALFIRKELIPMVEPRYVAHCAALSYDINGNLETNVEDIKKFELTTTSGPLWSGLQKAIEFVEAVGLETIESRVMTLTSMLEEELKRLSSITLLSPHLPTLASGLVSFSVSGREAPEITTYLWEQGRIAARSVKNPTCTRLSVAFFNTSEELETVVATLRRLVT
ncbi:MAG: aminotransferase class V-fold PLP-dependent enzyme [Chloroflexi bacterium]|nr:aminotransferase class V-fold PLP-dependent enzyme [Chloroflexota bacterium]